MILMDETYDRFGYSFRTLNSGSPKLVVCECLGCSELRTTEYRCYLKSKTPNFCKKCKHLDNAQINPKIDELVDVQATIDKFGYDPRYLTNASAKIIIAKCSICQNPREVVCGEYCRRKGSRMCHTCELKSRTTHHTKEAKRQAYNKSQRKHYKKIVSTEHGRLMHCLRISFNRAMKHRIPGCFRHLPYTKDQFFNHIQSELKRYNYICPLCKIKDLNEGYDIEHRVPISTAKSVEEVIELYNLDNLSVMCPDCNRKVKNDTYIEY